MKKILKKRIKRVALCLGVVLTCSHSASANLCDFEDAIVVPNQELASMRGGFITTSGLEISISIIKAIVIDGVLQTVSQLNIPHLGNFSNSSSNTTYPVSTPAADQPTGSTTAGATAAQPAGSVTAGATAAQSAGSVTAGATAAQPTGSVTAGQVVPQSAGETAAPDISTTPATVAANSNVPTITINSTQTELGTIVRNFGGPITVQNSRDGVTIQNNMTINAMTNSVTLLKQMNLSSKITEQLIRATYH